MALLSEDVEAVSLTEAGIDSYTDVGRYEMINYCKHVL